QLLSPATKVSRADLATPTVACPSCGTVLFEKCLAAPDRYHGRNQLYILERCRSCGLIRLMSPPSTMEMTQHYSAAYDQAVSRAGEDPKRWRGRRETVLRYKSGGAILDLGCSSGAFLSTVRSPAWQLFGVEISPAMAQQAESRLGAQVFVGN